MTHVAWESKIRSVVRPPMHPCPEDCMAITHAVKYFSLAAHAFSVGIEYTVYTWGQFDVRSDIRPNGKRFELLPSCQFCIHTGIPQYEVYTLMYQFAGEKQ